MAFFIGGSFWQSIHEFTVDREGVRFALDRCFNAGYSGRDQGSVQAHIDEMVEDGLSDPENVPILYELASYAVPVGPVEIAVVGPDNSGEAEFGMLATGGDTYVVGLSDHTDRNLETESIPKSK